VLNPEQIADFHRDGFFLFPEAFSAEEMKDILAWTEEAQNLPETPGRHMMYFEESLKDQGKRILQRLENIYPFHDGFQKLFDSERLKGAVSDLFGEPSILFKDKINFKLPGGDGFKWHQDQQAGWWDYAPLFITALVCIDEMTPDNGPLSIAAGYHSKGLVGKEWEPLNDAQMQGMDFQTFPMKPGDMMFFDSFAPHGSGPNMTDRPRRVLYVTYNKASDGDHRLQYYADKRKSFPPDCEREPGKEYKFRV